jgi:hypothetical protein
MLLTVIRDREQDLELAGIAAAALCFAGFTKAFPPDPNDPKQESLPSRPSVADHGSLEVMPETGNAPRVRAGFVRAGFDTIEKVEDPVIPPKANVVTFTVKPADPKDEPYIQMADPATDALCGAGLTVAYQDARSYSGNLSTDKSFTVQCDQADVAVVKQAFDTLWKFFRPDNPTGFLFLSRTLRTLKRLGLSGWHTPKRACPVPAET